MKIPEEVNISCVFKSQVVGEFKESIMHHAIPCTTEQGQSHFSFLSYSDEGKIPSRERQRDKENGKMLTCLQAAAESPGVNMREGEWNATEKRGRHTGVSEHSAPGPMAA